MKQYDVELLRLTGINACIEREGKIAADVARIGGIHPIIEFYENTPLVTLERQSVIQTITFCRSGAIKPSIVYYDGPIMEPPFLIITRENTYPVYDGVALGWLLTE